MTTLNLNKRQTIADYFCHTLGTQTKYYLDIQKDEQAAESYQLLQLCKAKEKEVKMKSEWIFTGKPTYQQLKRPLSYTTSAMQEPELLHYVSNVRGQLATLYLQEEITINDEADHKKMGR